MSATRGLTDDQHSGSSRLLRSLRAIHEELLSKVSHSRRRRDKQNLQTGWDQKIWPAWGSKEQRVIATPQAGAGSSTAAQTEQLAAGEELATT